MRLHFGLPLFGATLMLVACSKPPPPIIDDAEPTFVGSSACQDCHATEFADWQNSHHDLAMRVADADTVLGNFDDVTFNYFDTASQFFRQDGNHVVRTENANGELQDFNVAYTFGVEPLQQYLVEAPGGRLQALPFTWDSRSSAEGGQRWYHLYPDEYIGPGDPLHWTGHQQNWNYMCAECHSTDLSVNYDVASDSFATTWSEINVGCEACHGRASEHIRQARTGSPSNAWGLAVDLDDRGRAVWQINPQTGIADRSELLMRPPQQPESCGRCHARRGLVASEYEYGRPLADTHRIALLDSPLYFDDGQIRDEVYVYGSFLQSAMYRAGVTCSDCHNPHSLELVTGANANDVCTQCHLPARFASTDHHRHADDQVGCVDCHMTSRDYMGVDGRRDHSFRIPRPDLSLITNSPNACNSCHDKQDADWAAARALDWWGDVASRRPHFASGLHNARVGYANPELLILANSGDIPAIARGTALSLLAGPLGQEEVAVVDRALRNSDPLVRFGALQAARQLSPELQVQLAASLLEDPVRSVRIEAATLLAPQSRNMPGAAAQAFRKAATEFRQAQSAIASRPEAHASLGDFEASMGDIEGSLRHYEQSLRIEPDSPHARANFADALRRLGDESRAETVLREGIALNAGDAALRHSLGLLLVRSDRGDEGLQELQEAAALAPDNSRYTYVVAIALNSMGQPARATQQLETAAARFPGDFDIAWALATILRDQGETARARTVAQSLVARYPDNTNVATLLESLPAD